MTDQEAFDKVYTHLLKQGVPAISNNGEERYLADSGKRCAIGALIPGHQYKSWLEGLSAKILQKHIPALQGLNTSLLNHLQMIHDMVPPERWEHSLQSCAKYFKLTVPTKSGFMIKVPQVNAPAPISEFLFV